MAEATLTLDGETVTFEGPRPPNVGSILELVAAALAPQERVVTEVQIAGQIFNPGDPTLAVRSFTEPVALASLSVTEIADQACQVALMQLADVKERVPELAGKVLVDDPEDCLPELEQLVESCTKPLQAGAAFRNGPAVSRFEIALSQVVEAAGSNRPGHLSDLLALDLLEAAEEMRVALSAS